MARAVSAKQTVYILHSQECRDTGRDLRLCEFSIALDTGIDETNWEGCEDQPMRVLVAPPPRLDLIPVREQHVFIAGRCTHCNADGHSIGESDWCPVTGPERKRSWTFGANDSDTVEG
jgi:hypothetical protein